MVHTNKITMRYLLITIITLFSIQLSAQTMTNKEMGRILNQVADSIEGKEGYWQIKLKEKFLLVITDSTHNRMRIICPIAYTKDLKEGVLIKALEANFHTVLDSKYAISDNIMWSVFIHPLKELSEPQLKDAIKQVYSGALTFGGTYTSSELVFPGQKD